jgi:hypothetical protein
MAHRLAQEAEIELDDIWYRTRPVARAQRAQRNE